MTNTSTVAGKFKDAFYQMVSTLFQDDPQVLVSFGHPGTKTGDDMIVLLDVRTKQDIANLSITNRSREEELELDVYISSYRAGEADDDRVPSNRVYNDLLGPIELYCRTTDTTLGITDVNGNQVIRQCFLTSTHSQGSTQPSVLAGGRQVDLFATFTAQARITN